MISPVTPIQSPSASPLKASKPGVELARAKSWTRSPAPSCMVPKTTLPCTRRSRSRPATVAVSPVSAPASMLS
jgi:hypothetical protein